MGAVYRKTVTKPLPAGAEFFVRKGQRFVRWRDAKGRLRTAGLTVGNDGSERIVIEAGTYTAKFRDGAGVVQEVATGCRDETAARRVLGDLERRAELVKSGVMTAAEDSIADHQSSSLERHLAAYEVHLESAGTTKKYRGETLGRFRTFAAECNFLRLADLNRQVLEGWLVQQGRPRLQDGKSIPGASARTRNAYREAAIAFGNWCVETHRLISNPFVGIPKANQKADPRRQRRAMTEVELQQLLDVARERPLLDARTIRRGKDKGQAVAELRPETLARLECLGRERALIYKTLVLTGLRLNELRSLSVSQLVLDGEFPHVILHAADEKNREGSTVPLRGDLARDLREWIEQKAERLGALAAITRSRKDSATAGVVERSGKRLARQPVFTVPAAMVKILDRDLKLAGIQKRDERGRTLDVHALRTTFGTLLSKGGVAPRTAQAAMRHSTIDLTMNVYTDPKLLDVQGAVELLPSLSLVARPTEVLRAAKATGTSGSLTSAFAPAFAPTPDNRRQIESFRGIGTTNATKKRREVNSAVSSIPVENKDSLTTAVNESCESG